MQFSIIYCLLCNVAGSSTSLPLNKVHEACEAYLRRHMAGHKMTEELTALLNQLDPEELKLLNLTDAWLSSYLPHCLQKVPRCPPWPAPAHQDTLPPLPLRAHHATLPPRSTACHSA